MLLICRYTKPSIRLSTDTGNHCQLVGIYIIERTPVGSGNFGDGTYSIGALPETGLVGNNVSLYERVQVFEEAVLAIKINVVCGKTDISMPCTRTWEIGDAFRHSVKIIRAFKHIDR